MSKGYWIGRVSISDPEAYKRYTEANAKAFADYGARFLVRAGPFELLEGDARERNVVIEFPTYQAALDCWHSADYQAARALRKDASLIDLVVVEGYDGPQPGGGGGAPPRCPRRGPCDRRRLKTFDGTPPRRRWVRIQWARCDLSSSEQPAGWGAS